MKKLLTRLLLFTSLSILLLSGYTQSYADRDGETVGQSSINIKDQTYADFGGLTIHQSLTFKSVTSTSGKEKEHFKIDPAEVEEDEFNTFVKYLTGIGYFTLFESVKPSDDFQQNLYWNKYSRIFLIFEKLIILQVFRI